MYRKETIFEGYFCSCWETSYLSKHYEISKRTEEWFKQHLKELIENSRQPKEFIFFDDIIPKQVYKKLLKNPKTKFQFEIIVEAKEIPKINHQINQNKKKK